MGSLKWNKAFALEQTGNDEELLDELIILFKDSSASDYEQLKNAIDDKSVEDIVIAAHSLKGASASLGFEGVRELATSIETSARENDLTGMEDKGAAMEELLNELNTL